MKLNHVPRSVWRNPWHFVAAGFGLGAMPIMPGTFGTLAAIPLYLIIAPLPLWLYIGITLLLVVAGIFLCGEANREWGTADHPGLVWDELAAFPIVMIAVPNTWYFIALGFVLFRFFDILKPGPIRWLDKNVHGGLGVMLDDVVAALFSWLILQAVIFLLH